MTDLREEYIILILLSGIISAVYAILLLRMWWISSSSVRKAQFLNVWSLLPIMILAQYFIAGYFYNMSQSTETWTKGFDPTVILCCGLVALPGGVAIILRGMKPKSLARIQQLQQLQDYDYQDRKEVIHRDFVRKITHVAMFAAIFGLDFIGSLILFTLFPPVESVSQARLDFWGYGNAQYINFAWNWEDWGNPGYPDVRLCNSRILFFAFFYCLFYLMLTSELCRHSQKWQYFFDTAVSKTLRTNEGEKIASYVLFPAGYLLACIFLPFFAVAGMLAGGCLGDLAASQVGMRWGRHPYPHQRKTWEGLIAGCSITFLVSLPFLGVSWAIIWTACFGIVDLLTEKPIPVSDNLFLPLIGILIFSILPLVGVPIAPLMLALA